MVLRLHNPDLERDTRLLDGQPQAGELGAAERSLYRFSVEDAAAVSISITALSGEVDVYVAADGAAASPAHFTWKSAKTGSDLVAVAATTLGAALIGWRAWFASSAGKKGTGNKKGNPLEFMSLLMSLTKRW